jgi:hypothetical protein
MNFFNFLVTRQLVMNKTGDPSRANQLGMLTGFIPGTWGMMMGMLLADREEAPPPPRNPNGVDGRPAELPSGQPPTAAPRRS